MKMRTAVVALALLLFAMTPRLYADAAVLLAEPYGGFGRMNPTGHSAVYLSRVCAESLIRLRQCTPGESGVVISRYNKIAGYDWLAVPLVPYLYAVDDWREVPESADAAAVAAFRNAYRRQHLTTLVPDTEDGRPPRGEWYQLVGAAYDRQLFFFEIETTETQDLEFIREFNSRRNRGHFNLLYRNCADFTRDVINFYYPKGLKRSLIADVGITTPKQLAKSMVAYSRKHPELKFSAYTIPQIPGERPHSGPTRGVLESIVKSKKYAVPLVVVNLWVTPMLAAGYLSTGRFRPEKYAMAAYGPGELYARAVRAAEAVHAEESTAGRSCSSDEPVGGPVGPTCAPRSSDPD
jgi:hypothetical protein